MDENTMIDDLIKMLDNSIMQGIGHVNVDMNGSKTPLACSVPTLEQGLDDYQNVFKKEDDEYDKN